MVDFRRSKSFTTDHSSLPVDPGLPVGTYVFRLVVSDAQGNLSQPARIRISVVDSRRPIRIDRDLVFTPADSPIRLFGRG